MQEVVEVLLPSVETFLLCVQLVTHFVFYQVCPLVGARLHLPQNAIDAGEVSLSCCCR